VGGAADGESEGVGGVSGLRLGAEGVPGHALVGGVVRFESHGDEHHECEDDADADHVHLPPGTGCTCLNVV
jgi:hypothetical protein